MQALSPGYRHGETEEIPVRLPCPVEALVILAVVGVVATLPYRAAIEPLSLREHLRQNPGHPAPQCGLDPLELEVLRLQANRVLETAQDVAFA